MPRNPKPLDAPRTKTSDHYGAAHLDLSRNDLDDNVKILNNEINKTPKKTVLRVTKSDGNPTIYFRAAPKSQDSSKLKNKKEVESNRQNMREFLLQTVNQFEKKLGTRISDEEQIALNTLRSLASGQSGDITVGDVKPAFEALSKSKREVHIEKIKKNYQTPTRTDSQNCQLMRRRFGLIDKVQKDNLKKALFSSGATISDQSKEQAISAMQSLVAMQLKNPKASLQNILMKCQNKKEIEQFVDAWLSFRSQEKNGRINSPKQSALFPWAQTMDQLCADLKRSVFSDKNQSADQQTQRVILVDSPISPVIRKKIAGTGQPLTPNVKHTARKKKISVAKRNSPVVKPILQNKKTNISPVTLFRNTKSSSPVVANFISSFAFKLDDATSTEQFPGLMRRTESGDLERQFVFYEVAAAEAKAKSVLIKMRLEGLYRARSEKNNSPIQNLMSNANTSHTGGVRSFSEVRDQITAASATSSALALSPLPVGETIATVSKKGSIYKMELPSNSGIPIPLALSSANVPNLDEEQSTESTNAPALIYDANKPVSLANSDQ